jgi:gamma-glutamyl:cysteine ligase YbdK (ATP-grasp superfamily)
VLDNDLGTLYGERERKAIEKVENMKRNIRPSAKVINKKQFLTMLKEICEAGI